jgi:hypothetical protein
MDAKARKEKNIFATENTESTDDMNNKGIGRASVRTCRWHRPVSGCQPALFISVLSVFSVAIYLFLCAPLRPLR